MKEEQKIKLSKIIRELKNYRGRHTELITVYVPAGYNLNNVIKQLESEKSTAQNIKSKVTRKNVLDALERLTRHLRLYKKTPENGLALFSGNVSQIEGQQDIRVWSIEPPQKLKTKLYRCDQQFVLEPLKEMLEVNEVYGLIVIERKEATIGLLEGKNIKVLQHLTSGIPGKTEKGGQSAARYARIREGLAKEFFRRVAEAIKQQFFNMPKLRGLLVGGPGPTKEEFLKESELVTALRNKVLAVKDIGYSDRHGLELLVEASQDILAQQEIIHEKNLLKEFFSFLVNKPNLVVYGEEKVKEALNIGAVEKLLISVNLPESKMDELEEIAENIGASIYFISNETEEGIQFRNLTKGIGAILRFSLRK